MQLDKAKDMDLFGSVSIYQLLLNVFDKQLQISLLLDI